MDQKVYYRLFSYLKPHLRQFTLAFILSIFVGLVSTSPVPLIQKAFDKIFLEKNTTMLLFIPVAIVILYFFKCFFNYIQDYIMYSISWKVIIKLREELFAHILSLPLTFFHKDSTGDLMSRIIYDVSIMQKVITSIARDFIKNIVTLTGLLIWIFWYKWDWAVITLIIMPISIYPLSVFAKRLRRLGHLGQEKMGDITSVLQEAFSGIKTVKAFSMESFEENRLKACNEKFYGLSMKGVKYSEISSPMMEFMGVTAVSIFLWYGGYQVINGTISGGTFFAFIAGVLLLYTPAKVLAKAYSKMQESIAATERIFSVLDNQKEESGLKSVKSIKGFKNSIEFLALSFKYPTSNEWIIKDINLRVFKGEIIAIVGRSGAGKTTLVDLLPRFFEPTDGKILIDGTNIQELSLSSLRNCISIVTQDTFLFDDTIKNNISYPIPTSDFSTIENAAKLANAHNFIIEMENGYDTIIGERGVKLSGGQRQRLSIARAILKNAPILILDEATSALDSESEKFVQSALINLMKDKTTFIIAHRLSTIKNADTILVLHEGKIKEHGTHETLIKEKGFYYNYVELQTEIIPKKSYE